MGVHERFTSICSQVVSAYSIKLVATRRDLTAVETSVACIPKNDFIAYRFSLYAKQCRFLKPHHGAFRGYDTKKPLTPDSLSHLFLPVGKECGTQNST